MKFLFNFIAVIAGGVVSFCGLFIAESIPKGEVIQMLVIGVSAFFGGMVAGAIGRSLFAPKVLAVLIFLFIFLLVNSLGSENSDYLYFKVFGQVAGIIIGGMLGVNAVNKRLRTERHW